MRRLAGTILLAAACLWTPGCQKMADWLSQNTADTTSSTTEESRRPVTRRLCAVVVIGNLGEDDFVEESPSEVTETSTGKLATILNDPNLSEEEKDQKIKELIDQQKARLTPGELLESEKQKPSPKTEAVEKTGESEKAEEKNPTEAMSDTTPPAPANVPDTANENDPLMLGGEVSEETKAEAESLFMDAVTRGMESAVSKPAPATLEPPAATSEPTEKSPEKPAEETVETDEAEEAEETEEAEEMEEIDMSRKVTPPSSETDPPQKTPLPKVTNDFSTPEGLEKIHDTFERQAEAFLELNQNVPKGVKEEIQRANFQNYSVWVGKAANGDFYAVRYIEYVGDQFNVDYLLMTRSPQYKKWMKDQQPYLRQMSSLYSPDVWLEMSEVWHCD
ncbi:MAG: L-rhamnose mutarotase [Planctomycetia bacterium]|nr:L-rhamnose mutarotase [Planctomycetia bacterium]